MQYFEYAADPLGTALANMAIGMLVDAIVGMIVVFIVALVAVAIDDLKGSKR